MSHTREHTIISTKTVIPTSSIPKSIQQDLLNIMQIGLKIRYSVMNNIHA